MLNSWLRRAVATVRACGTIAALAFAASAGAAPVTAWTYGSSSLQFLTAPSDGGPPPLVWTEYAFVPVTVGASALANGLKIYGTGDGDRALSLTGETYVPGVSSTGERGNRLVISGTGTIDGAAWRHPQDLVRTSFAYGAAFSAGSVDVYEVSSSYELRDNGGNFVAGVGSSGGGYFSEPGAYGIAFAFEDRFGGDISAAVSVRWQVAINFDWRGYGQSDTLTFTIPQNSIDIQAVPGPGAVVLAAAGCLVGVPPRRRR